MISTPDPTQMVQDYRSPGIMTGSSAIVALASNAFSARRVRCVINRGWHRLMGMERLRSRRGREAVAALLPSLTTGLWILALAGCHKC